MAAHSSVLAWGLPWTEEPGGLEFIGLHRHLVVTEVKVTKLCLTFRDPVGCNPPVHGILQARILEWATIPFSRGSS